MSFTNETIGNYTDKMCRQYKNNEAIVCPHTGRRYTYGRLETESNLIAKGLINLGINNGEHVAIWALNSIEYIILQIATAKIGVVLVCLNSNYNKQELEYTINHSEATSLFINKSDKSFKIFSELCPDFTLATPGELNNRNTPKLKNIILLDETECNNSFNLSTIKELGKAVTEDEYKERCVLVKNTDNVSIQYTSGTTGNPKAVLSTHFSLLNNAIVSGEKFNYTPNDRLMTCLPLFHVMGSVLSVLICIVNGATIIILPRFKTESVLEYIVKERCTAINAVPTMFKFLLKHPEFNKYDMTTLNKGMIAGSMCSPELLRSIRKEMNVKGLCNIYGQTEGLAIIINDNIKMFPNSIGKGMPGCEIKIINPTTGDEVLDGVEGELCTRTPYIMSGYYKNKEATDKTIDKKGWLHTGDLAVRDENGYIRLIGRIKDIIIRGGENISPAEIEDLLLTIDCIKDVSIVSVPDAILGEEICAFIIMDEDFTMSEDAVKNFVKENLAKYKTPKYVVFTETFPTTSNGKVQKYILRDIASKQFCLSNNE